MNISRAITDRGARFAVGAVAIIATGMGTAVAIPAYAGNDDQGSESSRRQMHEQTPQNMTRMHELMSEGNPGMARMHELMMEENPGMERMHQRMMEPGSTQGGQE